MSQDQDLTRRKFLMFLGQGAVSLQAANLLGSPLAFAGGSKRPDFVIAPSAKDTVGLANGFAYQILMKEGDTINSKGETFGFNNDFTALLPIDGKKDEAILWVNHEYPSPTHFVSGWIRGQKHTKSQVQKEMKAVGGSLLHVKKSTGSDHWEVVRNDKINRRLDGTTRIPFAGGAKVRGSNTAVGTFANCAGGVTPWNTFLTAEENFQDYYGDRDSKGKKSTSRYAMGWEEFYNRPPEHYGWIVEVEPKTGKAKKLVALGRFAHEGAKVVLGKDGRCAVYSGDDASDRCFYKFIADKPNSLESGTLYVANVKEGKWLPLDREKSPELKKHFKTQTEVLVYAREAAELLGATRLDRPEGVDVHPKTGAVFLALTNNKKKGNFHGSIFKLEEKNNDPFATEFTSSTFMAGGEEGGFSCPDNLAFDKDGNLWMTTDISGSVMNKPPYEAFKNNGLFVIPTSGELAGKAFQVASAPNDAELTGPWFSDDGKTLFLSVQHPGENSSPDKYTSHWPEGGKARPKSAVITITGIHTTKMV